MSHSSSSCDESDEKPAVKRRKRAPRAKKTAVKTTATLEEADGSCSSADECGVVFDGISSRDDNFLGSIVGDIVGLRYYTGFVSRGEIVILRREPGNKHDKNAIRIDNTFCAQVGHLGRELAAFLAPLMDAKMIRVVGRVPCNKNTFSMPVELNIYATKSEHQLAVKEKFSKSTAYKLSDVDLFKGGGQVPFSLDAGANGAEVSASSTTTTTLTEKEVNSELDKIFEGLRETDKTEQKEPPPYLNKQLFPHQKNALAWMYRRENGNELPPFWKKQGRRYVNTLTHYSTDRKPEPIKGGILADDMGLGKTIQMISLILSSFHDGELFPVKICEADPILSDSSPGVHSSLCDIDIPGSSGVQKRRRSIENNAFSTHAKKGLRILSGDEEDDKNDCSYWSDDDFDKISLPPLNNSPLRPVQKDSKDMECNELYSTARATLIVCPVSVMSNWSDQIREHLKKSVILKVFQYYGSSRLSAAKLSSQDVVLTTYSTLSCAFKRGADPLFKVDWLRVVLDEGHMTRNPNSQMSKACCALQSERRWVLTGTPIQNKLLDLWSLVKFLRVQPLDDRGFWRVLFEKPITRRTKQGFERLKCFMQHLAMRRTKHQKIDGKALVDLPPKTVCLETLDLSNEERELYDVMHKEGKLIVNKYIREGTLLHHYAQVLLILLRLRQICCHPFLVKKAAERAKQMGQAVKLLENCVADDALNHQLVQLLVEILQSDADEQCSICLDSLKKPVITQCAHIYCNACIVKVINNRLQDKNSLPLCPLCRSPITEEKLIAVPEEKTEKLKENLHSNAEEWHSSVKMDALMARLRTLRQNEPTAKSLVVSQFTSFLDLIETPLMRETFSFVRLDGTMNQLERIDVVRAFMSDKKRSPTVLLLSLKAGGVGLNLMAANHVFLMEPAWNPAAEDQCFDRCHRLGQNKPVFVTKFVIRKSVEERMLELQEKKRELMTNSFSVDKIQARQQRINDIRLLMD